MMKTITFNTKMTSCAPRPTFKGSKKNTIRTRSVMRSTQTFSMKKSDGWGGTRCSFLSYWLCSWDSALFSRSINSIKYHKPQAKTTKGSRMFNTLLKSCKSPFNSTFKIYRMIPCNRWKTTSWNLTQIKQSNVSWRTIESKRKVFWRPWTSLRPE